jgi:hypothetical protein
MYLKRLHIGSYELCMFSLVIAASLLRFLLIRFNWPWANSDEATMDLMALHIAYRGEHPIFGYGQAYMGPLEAYIGAVFFRLFGPSIFTLRLGLIPLFALFLICMYFLTSLLYTKKLALAIVGLLSLGSSNVITRQLKAIGGYPEIVLFAALIFLIATQLALSSHMFSQETMVYERRKRLVSYGFLGVIAGLALWIDQLILPWLVAAGLLLFFFCRQELRTRAGVCLLLGGMIGLLPLIIYNVTAPLGENSLNVLYSLHRSGADEMAAKHIPFVRQFIGSFLVSLPAATGANPLCSQENFPLFGPTTAQTFTCTVWQGGWSLGFLALWTIATTPVASAVWKLWHQSSAQAWSFEERRTIIRAFARLMLLAGAAMTLALYTLSPSAALLPGLASRYLVCLLIATPAILWPLWHGISTLKTPPVKRATGMLIFRGGALLFIASTFLLGMTGTFADVPNAQAAYKGQDALIQDLLGIGATRIYSEYWTCNRLIFQSRERIICSVLDEHLEPGMDRYMPYRAIVTTAAHPTYVFPLYSKQAATIAGELPSAHIPYRRYFFESYVVYQTDTVLTPVPVHTYRTLFHPIHTLPQQMHPVPSSGQAPGHIYYPGQSIAGARRKQSG